MNRFILNCFNLLVLIEIKVIFYGRKKEIFLILYNING